MSDDWLRQLEARWRETRDALDESRYLLERMRAGELPRPRLELAAFLGHEAARLALPAAPAHQGDDPTRLASELWPWGKEAGVAAAVSAAHATLPEEGTRASRDRRPHDAIDAAAAWVHCPCDEHVNAARVAAEAALSAAGIGSPNVDAGPDRFPALAAHHAAAAASAWPFPVAMKHAYRSVKYAHASGALAGENLAVVICQALTTWALGQEHAPPDGAGVS